MTIKELEQRVEMTRANIRYYEKEGLLSVQRGENGYRDYSVEDEIQLKKIKLLRQLHVSVERIRQLQAGTCDLATAMKEQVNELQYGLAEGQAAAQICGLIEGSGIKYEELEPQEYLERICDLEKQLVEKRGEKEADASVSRSAAEFGQRNTSGSFFKDWELDRPAGLIHPWRRFFARTLDLFLCGLLWSLFQWFVLGIYSWMGGPGSEISLWKRIVDQYISYGLMFLLEPVLLSTIGTTPGKWLFGLVARARNGQKLSYTEALNRTWQVFGYGMGFGIPIWSLWKEWQSYQLCRDGEQAEWEQLRQYQIKDESDWRCVAFVILSLFLFAVQCVAPLVACRPANRGALTPEQYVENVNRLVRWYGKDQGMYMNQDGTWRTPEGIQISVTMGENGWYSEAEGLMNYDFILDDGYVAGVHLHYQNSGRDWIDAMTAQKAIAALAYLGSREDISSLEWAWWSVRMEVELLDQAGVENGSFDWVSDGISISQTVITEGYGYVSYYDSYLYQETPYPRKFELDFTVKSVK